jgi:hypothetical protein
VTYARRLIFGGALATVLGLAIAGTSPVVGTADAARIHSQQAAGGVVLLAGWVLLGWGVHRFGRER